MKFIEDPNAGDKIYGLNPNYIHHEPSETYWKSTVDEAPGTVTKEMLQEMMEKAREGGREVCGTGRHPHIISPQDYDAGSGRCQNCGQWIECHDR